MSEIEMKLKEKTKELEELCEKFTKTLAKHADNGIENLDTQEASAAADIIKDLAIAKEKAAKELYYCELLKAMEKSEYGEDYDENGPKYYRGRSASTGRFVHRKGNMTPIEMRDMDRSEGRMYYTEAGTGRNYSEAGSNRGYEEGHEDGRRKGYEEGRRMGYEEGRSQGYNEGRRMGYEEAAEKSESKYDKMKNSVHEAKETEKRTKAIQEYLHTVEEDVTEMAMAADSTQKQIIKNKLQAMQNKVV